MITTYHIGETLHEGSETIIYRGIRLIDNVPVVLKIPKNAVPSPRQIAKLVHQYEIIKDIDSPGIIAAYDLEHQHDSARLVLEDFRGVSLQHILTERTFTLEEVLHIGIQLAGTLETLHAHHIIHKDIKPHNIILNVHSGQVKITDFGIATRVFPDTIPLSNQLEGTLAYISPEQTGRMNRTIDHRSDLYSLGVTLYEMLTGVLPFQSNDPLELVHSHIARRPLAPHDVYPSISIVVSNIIMKLLAKNAEERYQQAKGLQTDLQLCLDQLHAQGQIDPFPLGKYDLGETLHMPQKLYGRDHELHMLLATFEQVSQGQTSLFLVSGYAGVGKSALIQEIHKPIVHKRGYFISGKFDQYQRNIPYSAIIQAFQQLIQQVLNEPAERVIDWQARIQHALGNNAAVIGHLLPTIEQLIGTPPPLEVLEAPEAQNRFQRTFHDFIEVFTQAEHPLVIFLDDLQWADTASLKLIQSILSKTNNHHLLLLGAYRDNEINDVHPLALAFQEMRDLGLPIQELVLQPLTQRDVEQLLCDTFDTTPEQTEALAQSVYTKTLGNPFFLSQFLNMLCEERLIIFDRDSGWLWNIERINQALATDNVLEFLANQIHKLSTETRHLLMLAACISNHFELTLLAKISEQSLARTLLTLDEAIREGLILPINPDYHLLQSYVQSGYSNGIGNEFNTSCRFLHDRVQQAAYMLLPETEQKQTHLHIGRLLIKHMSVAEQEEHLFDLINQLNAGRDLVIDPAERLHLIQLNLKAGQRARASSAYEAANAYIASGMELLDANSWDSHYELTSSLYQERALCESLLSHFELADSLFDQLLEHLRTAREQAKVYAARLSIYLNLNKFTEGVVLGCASLQSFGIELPEDEATRGAQIGSKMEEISELLQDKSIEDLEFSPTITDLDQQAAMHLLMALLPHAFVCSPSLFVLTMLEMVGISLKYGNTDLSAQAYVSYALMLAMNGNYPDAQRFGKLAMRINELYPNANLRGSTKQVFGSFIDPWNNHLHSSLNYLNQAYLDSVEAGNLRYAIYASWGATLHRYCKGDTLPRVLADVNKYLEFTRGQKDEAMGMSFLLLRQQILNLQGKTTSYLMLDSDQFNERDFLSTPLIPTNAYLYYWYKLHIFYTHEKYSEALEMARQAEPLVESLATSFCISYLPLYHALTLVALYPTYVDEQTQLREQIQNQLNRIRAWAQYAPQNFRANELLVAAELARISNQAVEAEALYDQAIDAAHDNDLLHIEALCLELAAKYYAHKGRLKIAKLYMSDAYQCYLQWGASAKVQQLSETYAALLPNLSDMVVAAETITHISTEAGTTDQGRGELLDMATIIKASQAISSEMVLDNVLNKLTHIVLESAGAQTGMLLLERDGLLLIEAVVTVDPDSTTLHLGPLSMHPSELPVALIHAVRTTGDAVVLHNAAMQGNFTSDSYIVNHQCKSILCLPLIHQGRTIGLLYLENNLATHVFTPARIELLRLLSAQAAIAIENAQLYTNTKSLANDLSQAYQQLQHEFNERQQVEAQPAALQEEVIRAQKSILAELSTPIIPITDHIVIMPLIGSLDSQRAEQVVSALLEGTQQHHARIAIIDITGVPLVDTGVARTLIQAARAVRLLGAQTLISGVRPEVAQTLVGLGVELDGITTQGSLQSSFAHAMRSLNTGNQRFVQHNGHSKGSINSRKV